MEKKEETHHEKVRQTAGTLKDRDDGVKVNCRVSTGNILDRKVNMTGKENCTRVSMLSRTTPSIIKDWT